MSAQQLEALAAYSACDISDALLKLEAPGAGFLADIVPIPGARACSAVRKSAPTPMEPASGSDGLTSGTTAAKPALSSTAVWASEAHAPESAASTSQKFIADASTNQKVIAPASTFLFVPKSSGSFPNAAPPLALFTQTLSAPAPNIPSGTPYADLTTPASIVVVSQPPGQVCAVVGGIMALRMARMGARGIVVDGRVRDLDALRALDIPVFSHAVSTVGTAGEAKAWAHDVPVAVGEALVMPGDVVMIDPASHAVVAIPKDLVDRVVEMLPRMVRADENVVAEVEAGADVASAFQKFRGL